MRCHSTTTKRSSHHHQTTQFTKSSSDGRVGGGVVECEDASVDEEDCCSRLLLFVGGWLVDFDGNGEVIVGDGACDCDVFDLYHVVCLLIDESCSSLSALCWL